MKIGIVTLPLHSNYGGILQAWALQTVLTRMGHDVKVIDKDYRSRKSDWFVLYPKRILKKYVLKQNVPIFHEKLQYASYLNNTIHTRPFIEKYIERRLVRNLSDIKKKDFDVYVFGSDQIWRAIYVPSFCSTIADAFGKFANKWNVIRLSYAASFGVDNLDEFSKSEIKKVKKELHHFKAVSVRESDGVNICKKYFDIDAIHVLDPTLLISKEEYLNLVDSIPVSKNGILEYILDPDTEKETIVKNLQTNLGETVYSPLSYGESQVSVEEWISGFRDAKMVVTDSFHACVFSIIFQKPFIVIANPTRGFSRIKSLLKMFDLQHHLVSGTDQIRSIDSYEIDSSVYDLLIEWQSKSMNFLKSTLSKR